MITESSNWIVNSDRADLRLIRAEAMELHENREDFIRKKILLKKVFASPNKHLSLGERRTGDEKQKKGTFQTFLKNSTFSSW